jgi:hypothetical protein
LTLKILKAKGELEKTKNCTQHYNVLCMLISVYGRSANSCRGHGGHSLPVNVTVTGTVQNYSDTGPFWGRQIATKVVKKSF